MAGLRLPGCFKVVWLLSLPCLVRGAALDGGCGLSAACTWDQYCDLVMEKCMSCWGLCRPGRINGDAFARVECEAQCSGYFKQLMKTTQTPGGHLMHMGYTVTNTPGNTQLATQSDSQLQSNNSSTIVLVFLVVLMVVTVTCLFVLIITLVRYEPVMHMIKKQYMTIDTECVKDNRSCRRKEDLVSLQVNESAICVAPEQSSSPCGEIPHSHLQYQAPRIIDDVRCHDKSSRNLLTSGQPSLTSSIHVQRTNTSVHHSSEAGSDTPLLNSNGHSDGAYSQHITSASEDNTQLKVPCDGNCLPHSVTLSE